MRRRIAQSAITLRFGCRVWSVASGFRVDVAGHGGHEAFTAPRLIAATGAHERVVPFPGWTLPGVIGLGGRDHTDQVAGACCPAAASSSPAAGRCCCWSPSKVLAAGGEIAAIADLPARRDWLAPCRASLRRPHLAMRGAGWAAGDRQSARAGLFPPRRARRAEDAIASSASRSARSIDRARRPRGASISLEADALAVGHGLVPGAEIPRLLRAEMIFDRLRGGWVPRVDAFGRTSLPGLYAVGDGAGIRGAEPALAAGELAGLAAASDAGRIAAATYERRGREAAAPARVLLRRSRTPWPA